MSNNKRDFKGIWISKQIWLNKKLTLQEKIFFVEIDSLDNEEGCFATNDYFATFFKISKTRVSLVIKSLIKKGLIKSTLIREQGNKRILKRVINKAIRPSLTFIKDPLKQKLKDNNTFNKLINNIVYPDNLNNEIFINKYREWINYRREIKHKLTISTINKQLSMLSKQDIDTAIAIINKSIEMGWQGLFLDNKQNKLDTPPVCKKCGEKMVFSQNRWLCKMCHY